MEVKDNGTIKFTSTGEYSNPSAQVVLGEHILCGMLIIPNENSIEYDGMKFYGMLQRSHIWLKEDKIFIENIYPDKENYDRLQTVVNILNQTINVIDIDESGPFHLYCPDNFSSREWVNQYNIARKNGCSPYLDRSQIDYGDGSVVLYGRNY